jgi:hypothetical protein
VKLSATKLFDAQSLEPEMRSKINPFVEWVNSNFDQVIRCLTKQVSVYDNMASTVLEVELTHAQAKDIDVPNAQRVKGIIPMRVKTATAIACTGIHWIAQNDGTVQVTPFYSDALATSKLMTTLLVIYR